MADAAKRRLVEVYIDTDSESESHTSSELAELSDDAVDREGTMTAEDTEGTMTAEDTEGTMTAEDVDTDVDDAVTAEEVGVVSMGEGPREDLVSPEMSSEEGTHFQLSGNCKGFRRATNTPSCLLHAHAEQTIPWVWEYTILCQ
jgi:hypothetical protein